VTRGVNLGGWLVLERWITPSVFGGLKAKDEHSFCGELGTQAEAVLKIHRDNFITEADFAWITAHGLTAVRLPVGYWIFGDEAPFVGGIEYVDKAFMWAEKYNLQILLDLHGAPGSQNGHDHSGVIGKISWNKPENIEKSLKTIERLAERYKGRRALGGIELLNEPSWRNDRKNLRSYYEKGYETVRKHCGTSVAVVVSDAFHPKRWRRVMRGDKYQNKQLDIHLYQLFGRLDKRRSYAGHIGVVAKKWPKLIDKLSRNWPVVIGEWSLSLPPKTYAGYDDSAKHAAIRAYGSMQLAAFEHAAGWFYWTYRTEYGGTWSYRTAVENGWLPPNYGPKA
jgi:glucan 1,3-beta-glucosidase